MKIGLFITNQQHLETDMVSALDDQYAMVRTARDHGWDSLFSGQHYLNEGNNKQLQLVPFLARMQAEAGEMTLGLGILLINLHNPVYVAETVATMDVICRGNFVFGVGLGYRQVEFDAFRVPKGQRVARFEECLELVQRLWTAQRPYPPIWFAANNDNAVRRAARLGDTWFINPHATTETNKRQIALYREELDKHNKPFPQELPIAKEIFCAKDRKTAIEMAGPYLAAKYKDYSKWGQDKAMPGDESLDQPLEKLLQDRFVLGSPEECYEQLRPNWEELGANHLIFRTHWAGMPLSSALHSMRLISRELIPELRKL